MEKIKTGIKDDDGEDIYIGDTIHFFYGIPPICVDAPVVVRGGEILVLTPEHSPKQCKLKNLKKYAGSFWRVVD